QASVNGFQSLGDKYYAAMALDDLGWSYQLSANRPEQRIVVTQSLALRREIDDRIGIANSLRNLGGVEGGFFNSNGKSFGHWQEAKEIAYQMNDRLGVAWNASLQANIRLLAGAF